MRRRKVGLALGGGAAKGIAHVGVLEVLEREGVPIDMVAGTSMGALVGAIYVGRGDVRKLRDTAMALVPKKFDFLVDLVPSKTGIMRAHRIEAGLKSLLGDVHFDDLRIPFACVATDITNGAEVVIREGLVWKAVRASSTIPVLFDVARWDGRYLVDGGLVNPVPISVLKTMGAEFIIAVNVLSATGPRERNRPNLFNMLLQVVHIAGYSVVSSSLRDADIVIEPQVGRVGFTGFHRAAEAIHQGALAAEAAIPEIKRRLWS